MTPIIDSNSSSFFPLSFSLFLFLLLSSSSPQIIDSVKSIDLQSDLDAMIPSTNFKYCQYYSLDRLDHYCLLLSRRLSASARISSEIKDFDVDPANVFVAFPYNHNTVTVVFPVSFLFFISFVHPFFVPFSFNSHHSYSFSLKESLQEICEHSVSFLSMLNLFIFIFSAYKFFYWSTSVQEENLN